jgi:hydrogenase-4 component F
MGSWAPWLAVWLALPVATAAVASCMRSPRSVLNVVCAGILTTVAAGAAMLIWWHMTPNHLLETGRAWFRMDALSAYHLAILMIVHGLSTVYARIYFGAEIQAGHLTRRSANLFAALWSAAFVFMALVLLSNNLGIMWVSLEATTLVTAFLICVHKTRESLEAMWKYIVICSVGIAFAFVGEVLVASAARQAGVPEGQMLLLSHLALVSPKLSPVLLKLGFLMLLVGYGTKAGLAPMHNWLPDAHSQAPAPVSALFSGFMLNAAFYCILRHIPIVNGATGGAGWAQGLLTVAGLFSIGVAAAFIMFQRDIKRFLAYSSVEHIGVISLGFGVGGLGAAAALFHALNHSVGKTLAFFAAGRLGQCYGTYDMGRLRGALRVMRVWGIGALVGILALIGLAPFSVFMSEFRILLAAVSKGAFVVMALFLAGIGVVFVGALGHVISVAWGDPPEGSECSRASATEWVLLALMGGMLLALGVWMPGPLQTLLNQAAAIVQQVPGAAAAVAQSR